MQSRARRVRVVKCDHSVQDRICTCCLSGCSVYTSRRLAGGFCLQSTEMGPNSENFFFHESSDHEECLEFLLFGFQLFRSPFVDEDEAVGKFHRDSPTAQSCPFRCLIVDCEEWFCSLAESLPYVRRAIGPSNE